MLKRWPTCCMADARARSHASAACSAAAASARWACSRSAARPFVQPPAEPGATPIAESCRLLSCMAAWRARHQQALLATKETL